MNMADECPRNDFDPDISQANPVDASITKAEAVLDKDKDKDKDKSADETDQAQSPGGSTPVTGIEEQVNNTTPIDNQNIRPSFIYRGQGNQNLYVLPKTQRVLTDKDYTTYTSIRDKAKKENEAPDYSDYQDNWTEEDMKEVEALRRDPQYAKYFTQKPPKTYTEKFKDASLAVLESLAGVDNKDILRHTQDFYTNVRRGIDGLLDGKLFNAISGTLDASFNAVSMLGDGVNSVKHTLKRKYGVDAAEAMGHGLKEMAYKKELALTQKELLKDVRALQTTCAKNFGYVGDPKQMIEELDPLNDSEAFPEFLKKRGYSEQEISQIYDILVQASSNGGNATKQDLEDLAYMMATGDYGYNRKAVRDYLVSIGHKGKFADPALDKTMEYDDDELNTIAQFLPQKKPLTLQNLKDYYLDLAKTREKLERDLADGSRGYAYRLGDDGLPLKNDKGEYETDEVETLTAKQRRVLQARIEFYTQAMDGMVKASSGLLTGEESLVKGRINQATYTARQIAEMNKQTYHRESAAYQLLAGSQEGTVGLASNVGSAVIPQEFNRRSIPISTVLFRELAKMEGGDDSEKIRMFKSGLVPANDPVIQRWLSCQNAYACMDAHQAYNRQCTLLERINPPDKDSLKDQALEDLEKTCSEHPWRGQNLSYVPYVPVNLRQWAKDKLNMNLTEAADWDQNAKHMFPDAHVESQIVVGLNGEPIFSKDGKMDLTMGPEENRMEGISSYYSHLVRLSENAAKMTDQQKKDLRKLNIFRAYQLRRKAVEDLANKIARSDTFKDIYTTASIQNQARAALRDNLMALYGAPKGEEWDWLKDSVDFTNTPSDNVINLVTPFGDWSTWDKADAFEKAQGVLGSRVDLNSLSMEAVIRRELKGGRKPRAKSGDISLEGNVPGRPNQLTPETIPEYMSSMQSLLPAEQWNAFQAAVQAIQEHPDWMTELNTILDTRNLPEVESGAPNDMPAYLERVGRDLKLLTDLRYISPTRNRAQVYNAIKSRVSNAYAKTQRALAEAGNTEQLFDDMFKSDVQVKLNDSLTLSLGKVFIEKLFNESQSQIPPGQDPAQFWLDRAIVAATDTISELVDSKFQIPVTPARKSRAKKQIEQLKTTCEGSIFADDEKGIDFAGALDDIAKMNELQSSRLTWRVDEETGLILPFGSGRAYSTKLGSSKSTLFTRIIPALAHERNAINGDDELKNYLNAYIDTLKAYSMWKEFGSNLENPREAFAKIFKERLTSAETLIDKDKPYNVTFGEYDSYRDDLGIALQEYSINTWEEPCDKFRGTLPLAQPWEAPSTQDDKENWCRVLATLENKGLLGADGFDARVNVWARDWQEEGRIIPPRGGETGIRDYVQGEIRYICTRAMIENGDYSEIGKGFETGFLKANCENFMQSDGDINPKVNIPLTAKGLTEALEKIPPGELFGALHKEAEDGIIPCTWDDWLRFSDTLGKMNLGAEGEECKAILRKVAWDQSGLKDRDLYLENGTVRSGADNENPPEPKDEGVIVGWTQDELIRRISDKMGANPKWRDQSLSPSLATERVNDLKAKIGTDADGLISGFYKSLGGVAGEDVPVSERIQEITNLNQDMASGVEDDDEEYEGEDRGTDVANGPDVVSLKKWSKNMQKMVQGTLPISKGIGNGIPLGDQMIAIMLPESKDKNGNEIAGITANEWINYWDEDDDAGLDAAYAAMTMGFFPIEEFEELVGGEDVNAYLHGDYRDVIRRKNISETATDDKLKSDARKALLKRYPILWAIGAATEPDMTDNFEKWYAYGKSLYGDKIKEEEPNLQECHDVCRVLASNYLKVTKGRDGTDQLDTNWGQNGGSLAQNLKVLVKDIRENYNEVANPKPKIVKPRKPKKAEEKKS